MRSPDTLTSPATRNRIPPQWWPWCSTAARLVLAGVWALAGAAAADGPRSLRKLGRDGLCLAILVAAGAPSVPPQRSRDSRSRSRAWMWWCSAP